MGGHRSRFHLVPQILLRQKQLPWNVTHLQHVDKDLAEAIRALKERRDIDPSANIYPRAEDGLRSMAAVFAVAKSGGQGGTWIDARPPMFR